MIGKNIADDFYKTSVMTPPQVIKILAKHGTIVTEEEAEIISAFVFKRARIAVD